jgi:hypothetical protein
LKSKEERFSGADVYEAVGVEHRGEEAQLIDRCERTERLGASLGKRAAAAEGRQP